jgi:signal transduction histidine kinase
MADDDIYERHQTMTALTGVLLHDLRNPLHSATLLVEALGTGGDASALRTKLRAQFAKLDGLISTAAAPIRELAVDPRVAKLTIGELFRTIDAGVQKTRDPSDLRLTYEGDEAASIVSDRILLGRTVVELCLHLVEELQPRGGDGSPVSVSVRSDVSDEKSVRIEIESPTAVFPEAAHKAPFGLASGGVRLALARALSQTFGVALRLERRGDERVQFVLTVPREDAHALA